MLRHLGPVSLFSKVRHPTSWPGSQSVTSVVLFSNLCGPVFRTPWGYQLALSRGLLVKKVLKQSGQQHALWWSTKKPGSGWLTFWVPLIDHLKLPSSWLASKGGRGKGKGEGEHKKYLLHLKKGVRGKSYVYVHLIQLPWVMALWCCLNR